MNINYFLYWLPMILIAFANAALRETVFINHTSELHAHQLSTVTLIVLCTIYAWFIFPFLCIQNAEQALLAGFTWVVLTVLFEFSLGRLTNKSWDYLFKDYNLIEGRIWLLFLLCLFFLPWLYYVIRNR